MALALEAPRCCRKVVGIKIEIGKITVLDAEDVGEQPVPPEAGR